MDKKRAEKIVERVDWNLTTEHNEIAKYYEAKGVLSGFKQGREEVLLEADKLADALSLGKSNLAITGCANWKAFREGLKP